MPDTFGTKAERVMVNEMYRIVATRIAILGPEAALEPLLRFCAILPESRFWDQNRFQNHFQNRSQNRPKLPTLTTPNVKVGLAHIKEVQGQGSVPREV